MIGYERPWKPSLTADPWTTATELPMELNQLETFLAVAEERSFSRAAVRLHRTQPAVSQVIRKLEEVGRRNPL